MTAIERLIHYCEGLFPVLTWKGHDMTHGFEVLRAARADLGVDVTSDDPTRDAPPLTDADAPGDNGLEDDLLRCAGCGSVDIEDARCSACGRRLVAELVA